MFWAKFNAKINSALIISIILTLLWLVFSKEAILFLIYLLADKAIYFRYMQSLYTIIFQILRNYFVSEWQNFANFNTIKEFECSSL